MPEFSAPISAASPARLYSKFYQYFQVNAWASTQGPQWWTIKILLRSSEIFSLIFFKQTFNLIRHKRYFSNFTMWRSGPTLVSTIEIIYLFSFFLQSKSWKILWASGGYLVSTAISFHKEIWHRNFDFTFKLVQRKLGFVLIYIIIKCKATLDW